MSRKETENKAIDFILCFEKQQGRNAMDVRPLRKEHRGYDVKSGSRMIEVKGVRESWKTYTWTSLHKTEIECLRQNPGEYWLYIVKFKGNDSDEIEAFYALPGLDLINDGCFRIQIENYALTPISKRSLSKYRQSFLGPEPQPSTDPC